MWTAITDKHELQNLLDDFSPHRPELNVYSIDGPIHANTEQLLKWRAHPERFVTRNELTMSETEKLRAFAQQVMTCWPGGDVDGGFLQDAAEACGLIELKTMDKPCGENCQCAEYGGDFPTTCYRKTRLLTGE